MNKEALDRSPLLKARFVDKAAVSIVFAVLFLFFYIFFRYAHPVMVWDGDDWRTAGGLNLGNYPYALPQARSTYLGFCRFLPCLLGTLFGDIAAFVIYPLTGDYLMSFVTVSSLALSLSICLSLAMLYRLFRMISGKIQSLIVIFFFVAAGFLIFKTKEKSEYLYWNYNYCTVYWYSIPSYLTSAFGTYLIIRHIEGKSKMQFNLQTGLFIGVCYFLVFSFLPAALFLTIISFFVLVSSLFKIRKLKSWFKECWFYFLQIFFFLIEVVLEFYDNFGTGYFESPLDGGVAERLSASLSTAAYSLARVNKLFVFFIIVPVFLALFVYILHWRRKRLDASDKRFFRTFLMIFACFFLLGVFFILFGIVDLGHVFNWGYLRMDTLYCYYFSLISIGSLSLVYVLDKVRASRCVVPLAIVLMGYTALSPFYHFSSSVYDVYIQYDQQYEIMSKVVSGMQEKVSNGATSVVVHIPECIHYGGDIIGYALYNHGIVSFPCSTEFVYDSSGNEVWFE